MQLVMDEGHDMVSLVGDMGDASTEVPMTSQTPIAAPSFVEAPAKRPMLERKGTAPSITMGDGNLSRVCVDVKRTKKSLDEQRRFWENRLLLLKREAEKAKASAHLRRLATTTASRSAVGSKTVEKQLEEERSHNERARIEKLHAIEEQKAAHRKALRQALQQRIHDKLSTSKESKRSAEERRSLVQRLRDEVSDTKKQKRDKVLSDRQKARDKAARTRAMRNEEATRNYEAKIRHIQEEGEEVDSIIKGYMQESQQLLETLKRLEGLQQASNLTAADIETV